MSLETDLRTLLLADNTLSGLISTRMYPDLAPQEADRPYVIFRREGAARFLHSEGANTIQQPRIVFEVFASSRSVCRQVADAIIDVLHGLRDLVGSTYVRRAEVDDEADLSVAPVGGDEDAIYSTRLPVLVWIK